MKREVVAEEGVQNQQGAGLALAEKRGGHLLWEEFGEEIVAGFPGVVLLVPAAPMAGLLVEEAMVSETEGEKG